MAGGSAERFEAVAVPAGDVEYGSKKKGVATSSVIRDELAQVLCAQPGGVLVQSLATAERRGHGASRQSR